MNVCTNRLANGATCTSDSQCASTDYCVTGASRTCQTKVPFLTPNTCADSNDAQCDNGYCNSSTCTPLIADGGQCDRNTQCSSGYCHTSNNVCTAVPAAETTCGTGKDGVEICAASDFCRTSGNSKTCKARATSGANCNKNSLKCVANFYCHQSTNKCTAVSASEGHRCSADLNCADSQYCNGGVCADRLISGSTGCNLHNQCP